MYRPHPKDSVTDIVCKNTQKPPKAKNTANRMKRIAGFDICVAAIHPFDSSSKPVRTIPAELVNKLGNHVHRYDSKILNTITQPQTVTHADVLVFMDCATDDFSFVTAENSDNSGFGSRKPVTIAEKI